MNETTQGEYRELTLAAVVLGVFQGVILNLAFVYAALKLGFSIGGSTVAAIMGYALLRGVLKKGTSIENNINGIDMYRGKEEKGTRGRNALTLAFRKLLL